MQLPTHFCNKILTGDACEVLSTLPKNSVDCCVTSPPYYGLRNYGVSGQIGLENHPKEYIAKMTEVFMQVYRVLKKDGTLWIVINDSYAGSGRGNPDVEYTSSHNPKASFVAEKPQGITGYKHKDLMGIPFLLAASLRDAGWYWRACNIWHKPSVLPESVKDRPTNTHEYILLFSKNSHYYYDYNALLEPASYDGRSAKMHTASAKYSDSEFAHSIHKKDTPRWHYAEVSDKVFGRKMPVGTFRNDIGRVLERLPVRNKRSVWVVPTAPLHEAHFAAYPPKLIEPMIKAGCREGGIVLDPFMGAGTTAIVARKLNRNYAGIELNPQYVEIIERRLKNELGLFE